MTRVGGLEDLSNFPILHKCYCGISRIDQNAAEADAFWRAHRAEHAEIDRRARRAERATSEAPEPA